MTQGGRDHTSHRLVYRGLSERRAVLLSRRCLGSPRPHEPRLRRPRQRPDHDDRRARHVRAPAAVRRVPLRRRRRPRRSGPLRPHGTPRRHARRRRSDGRFVLRRLRARRRGERHARSSATSSSGRLPAVVFCRYIALFLFGLYRRDRHYSKRVTLARIGGRCGQSELVAYLFVTNTQPTDDFPATIFVSTRSSASRCSSSAASPSAPASRRSVRGGGAARTAPAS